jgi:hypothetical protein
MAARIAAHLRRCLGATRESALVAADQSTVDAERRIDARLGRPLELTRQDGRRATMSNNGYTDDATNTPTFNIKPEGGAVPD